VVMGLALLIEGAVVGWSTLYLHDHFHVAASAAAVGYLVYEMSMVAGRLVGDRSRHALGDARAAFVGSALAVVGLAVVVISPNAALAVAGLVVVGFGQAVVVPVAFATAGLLAPAVAAEAIARVGGFGYAGMLAGPAAFGFLAQATSMRAGFAAVAGLALLMAAATTALGGLQASTWR